MNRDRELLERYASQSDSEALREWIRWRIDLVYSVASRVLGGDPHLAEDVTQQVLTTAAQRAGELARHPAPGGWLFHHTRFTAAKLVRSRQRRQQREHLAAMDPALNSEPPVDWSRIRPEIDAALDALPDRDRDAVILRYFEQADYGAIGERLQLSANAARMRVDRALEKLSIQLGRRGIRSTAAALGTALGTHAVSAAPPGLAATVTGAALAGTSTLTLTSTSLLAMLKAPLVATAVVIATGTLLVSHETAVGAATELPSNSLQAPPPSSAATSIAPTVDRPSDADYRAMEQEITALQTRLAELDRAAVAQLKQPPLRGRIHSVQELDVVPKPIQQNAPKYPVALRNQGTEGKAVISMVIDAQGAVRDLTTVSSTDEDFARAALNAVSSWQFEPGRIGDVPVNSRLEVPILFNIRREPSPPPPLHDWF